MTSSCPGQSARERGFKPYGSRAIGEASEDDVPLDRGNILQPRDLVEGKEPTVREQGGGRVPHECGVGDVQAGGIGGCLDDMHPLDRRDTRPANEAVAQRVRRDPRDRGRFDTSERRSAHAAAKRLPRGNCGRRSQQETGSLRRHGRLRANREPLEVRRVGREEQVAWLPGQHPPLQAAAARVRRSQVARLLGCGQRLERLPHRATPSRGTSQVHGVFGTSTPGGEHRNEQPQWAKR